eukprot:TRINITY_DN5761_c0_g6_i2.p1 TRINITY_DN5761_c0_g6~~TRINITY_DN5761_c0_g6_i2.p1  ORF type:complete len:223 (-),score=45.20 TRINITY_DN5761_c0_g6_i2:16-684(-)
MGNCCRSSSKNDGITLDDKQSPLPNFSDRAKLTEIEYKMVMRRIWIMKYNTKLYEKRNLQSRRAKILIGNNKKPNDEYSTLIQETRAIESESLAACTAKVLEDYMISPATFEASKEGLDREKLEIEAVQGLMEEIRELQEKLGVNQKMLGELNAKCKEAYREAEFTMNSYPDVAQRLAALFENEPYLDCVDVIAADILYLSLIHICRCRRYAVCRSRWSPYH